MRYVDNGENLGWDGEWNMPPVFGTIGNVRKCQSIFGPRFNESVSET